MSDDRFVCEICGEDITADDRVVRIAAEACVNDELFPSESVVFGVFHSMCVVDTFRDNGCDEVPYIEEAREVIVTAPLCECCNEKMKPEVKSHGLRLIRGGVR